MFSEIQYVTVCIFCLLAIFQKSNSRFFPAVILSVTEIVHYTLYDSADGLLYYGSDALLDLLAIMIIAKLAIPTALATQLLYICFASIIFNCIGLALWFPYISPIFYNWSFIVLNLFTIICLIKRESDHGGRATDNSGNFIVYRHNHFSR